MNLITHSASTLGPAEAAGAQEVLARNYAGYGPEAAKLEARFARRTGRRHVFAVTSGSHALALAVRALDLPPASEIALPVLTCPSVAAAVIGAGHRCRLVDIRQDLTMDVARFATGLSAIIAPHAYGAPVDVFTIAKSGLPWIEDCATSPATTINGTPVGGFGTLAVFSLGSTKYITGGAGGVLVTDSDALAVRIADLLDFDRPEPRGDWTRGLPPALPGRLPDLNAAVALVQLERIEEFAARRRATAALYDAALAEMRGVEIARPCSEHSFYRYIVKTAAPSPPLSARLHERGIDARASVNPWLDAPRFSGRSFVPDAFPVADGWRSHLLSLPIYPGLQGEEARFVVREFQELTNNA